MCIVSLCDQTPDTLTVTTGATQPEEESCETEVLAPGFWRI
jgi:hypothetical protein